MASGPAPSARVPLLVAGAVLLSVAALVVVAYAHGARSPRFQADPGWFAVERRPDWMPEVLAERLASHLGTALGPPASLLDPGDLERWREDLPDLAAWIASVETVSPRFPGQVEVRLHLRRPVLVLPEDLLVAADGERVGFGRIEAEPRPLPCGADRPEDVLECAAAAGEILPFRLALAERGLVLDGVGLDPDGKVVFLTEGGVELEWGRSARRSEFAPVDLPPVARVDNLRVVLDRRPGLAGVARVVLWKDRPDVVLAP